MIEINIESFFMICGGVCIFGLGVLLIALAYHTTIDAIVKNRLFRNPTKIEFNRPNIVTKKHINGK